MSELLLAAGPLDKVLEIGTGSGYQTAILAQLVERVFSVERIQGLQDKAKERLAELNLRNVVFRWKCWKTRCVKKVTPRGILRSQSRWRRWAAW